MPNDILKRARVLIIDDEASNVRLLERILELCECTQIRSTSDSRQALSLFLELEPDLVLLDLHMPHMDGFAVMTLLREITPANEYLPILVLTADITAETKRRALASGAKDLVTKPLDHSEVVLRMKNLVEIRFLHQELQKQNGQLEQQVRERTAQLEQTLHQLSSTQEAIVKQERLRALGMMAGGIAHDFNNALTMVLGYGELLLPYVQLHAPERERTYLHNMMSAAQDATHVVSRLRDFYRPASGNEIRVALDINEVVQQAVSLTSPKWKGRSLANGVQINLRMELCALMPIAGHAAELREVLTNLIFNAVDAMPNGGNILVRTVDRGDHVLISVVDSGMGMTEEERAQCLEPFFTTKGDGGTGLGLSVVYGIIQRHDGTIEIASTKGEGATFTLCLPVTSKVSEAILVPVDKVDRSLRILVVDDQEIICELIAEYLRGDNHTATVAAHGLEALSLYAPDTFDLVITDQSMPEMNGVQLAMELKRRDPELPIILLTGFGDEMQATGERPHGIDLVVGKPVSASDLRQALFSVISAQSERSTSRSGVLIAAEG